MANKKDQAEVMEQASTEQNVAAVETQETPVDELSTEQVAAMDEKDTADQAAAEKDGKNRLQNRLQKIN